MAAPHRESAAPISPAHNTRGSRTDRRIAVKGPSGPGRPSSAPPIMRQVSSSGMRTLPRLTLKSAVNSVSAPPAATAAALRIP